MLMKCSTDAASWAIYTSDQYVDCGEMFNLSYLALCHEPV